MPKEAKNVTIDDLAAMVGDGFQEIHQKMDKGFKEVHEKMDKGFKEVHEELGGVKDQISGIDRRLDKMADNYGPRLNRIDKHLGLPAIH